MLFLYMNATMTDFRKKEIASLAKHIIILLPFLMLSSLHVESREVSSWAIMLKNYKASLDKLLCDQRDLNWVRQIVLKLTFINGAICWLHL